MSLPVTVIARPEVLRDDTEVGEFVIQKFLQFIVRVTIVWGFLAIFFPQLGVTYILVLAGLIALRAARGIPNQNLVNIIRRGTERRERKAAATFLKMK